MGSLRKAPQIGLICAACGEIIPLIDGIADFVRSRHDTVLDVESYDHDHGVSDAASDLYYDRIRDLAGERWPVSLGAVLEIGCGTGLFSRALLNRAEAQDVLLTDVSVPMLRSCRRNLQRLGLLEDRPVGFASYSSHEACLRDAVFDTCIGTSALHHIPDVRSFLAAICHSLKPEGCAFFLEPNQRHYRALGQALADAIVLLYARDPSFIADSQLVLNLLAEWRRQLLHQGDIAFLSQLEDKHFFLAEEFEDMASEVGFATAEMLPFGPEPTGLATVISLCNQIGTTATFRDTLAELLLAVGGRHLDLLCHRDTAPTSLLWLTKDVSAAARVCHRPRAAAKPPVAGLSLEATVGGLAPHWSLDLLARSHPNGVILKFVGWCLLNVDVSWVRIVLNGVARDAPVWLPRPDVHLQLNKSGLYGAWNALCCGVQAEMIFGSLRPIGNAMSLAIELVLSTGRVLTARSPSQIRLEEATSVVV
jgi:2-polyprenyl-3-methyl-5-hydroxy-6-metoxy-1,4-benzoquinol methylase